ncbi:MAG: hypothetical protein V4857_22875, partial [Pseudomonadota bacterium]
HKIPKELDGVQLFGASSHARGRCWFLIFNIFATRFLMRLRCELSALLPFRDSRMREDDVGF